MGRFDNRTLSRLGGYEDVNDADLLGFGPAMRWIVGGSAVFRQRASASQMVQFETEVLATDDNVSTLAKRQGRGSKGSVTVAH